MLAVQHFSPKKPTFPLLAQRVSFRERGNTLPGDVLVSLKFHTFQQKRAQRPSFLVLTQHKNHWKSLNCYDLETFSWTLYYQTDPKRCFLNKLMAKVPFFQSQTLKKMLLSEVALDQVAVFSQNYKIFCKAKTQGWTFFLRRKNRASLPFVKQFCQTPTFFKRKRIFWSTSGINCCFHLFLKRETRLKSVCLFMEKMQNDTKTFQMFTTFGVEFFDGVSSVVQREKPKKKVQGRPSNIVISKNWKKLCFVVCRATVYFEQCFSMFFSWNCNTLMVGSPQHENLP